MGEEEIEEAVSGSDSKAQGIGSCHVD